MTTGTATLTPNCRRFDTRGGLVAVPPIGIGIVVGMLANWVLDCWDDDAIRHGQMKCAPKALVEDSLTS
jgi:hypothetical protein